MNTLPPGYRRQPGHQAKWLWRTLRGAELAGLDPAAVLADAVADRDLAGSRDIAAVLDARIRHRLGTVVPLPEPLQHPTTVSRELLAVVSEDGPSNGVSLAQCDRMIDACDSHGVKVFVVHQNRYNPAIMKAREALEQGRFGKLVLGTVRLRWKRDQAYYDSEAWRGTWAHDGGVFMNQAVHHIDMLTWFLGNVESVRSLASTRLVNIEAEDTGVAVIRFNSGALGVLEATTAARPKDLEGSISILGEKGTVVIGGFFMNELVTWSFEDKQPIDDVVFEKYGKNPPEFGANLGEYLKGVIASIKTKRAALVDGLEGRRSLELITALYESIETNTDVQLRFRPKKCRLGMAS